MRKPKPHHGLREKPNLISPRTASLRTGSILDHFITSTDITVKNRCQVFEIALEHAVIVIQCTLNFCGTNLPRVKTRKWHKVKWEEFQVMARLGLTTRVPVERNVSNDEIDQLVEEFTLNINIAIDSSVPLGYMGRGPLIELPQVLDHWYRERRRLTKTIRRVQSHWLMDVDRIEHLKRGVAKATRLIEAAISEAKKKVLSANT